MNNKKTLLLTKCESNKLKSEVIKIKFLNILKF